MTYRNLIDLMKDCDAIVYSNKKDHKLIFLKGNEPSNISPDRLRRKGRPYVKSGRRLYDVIVDMYEIKNIKAGDGKPVDIWIVDDFKQGQDQLNKIISGGAEQFKSKIIINKKKLQRR